MNNKKKRIYILVKTYPTISDKYAELVCTAGILEDGSWIRLYPVPFRLLNNNQKYPKYTWIHVDAERNTADFRPESYRPDLRTLVVEPKPKKVDWDARRRIVFNNTIVYTNLKTLIDNAKSESKTSLAIFKPKKIIDFIIQEDDREWDSNKLTKLANLSKQLDLFKTVEDVIKEYRAVPKVPYKFYYQFEDDHGTKSKMKISDWEIGMLYWNCLKRANNNEAEAVLKVKEKYFNSFAKHDLYFFLGTTLEYQNKGAKNPFMIVGVFYPPILMEDKQLSLF
ncbi:MAG: hypothetical protein ACOYEL_06365 [Saccharofermentanales bacterium]|jgi:hypothetical protein